MCQAKTGHVRAYLLARCVKAQSSKKKLLVEITQSQTPRYKDLIGVILREAQQKARDGTMFLALKSWAKARRAELLK